MQAELKRVRKTDEDPYDFSSEGIGKMYPHRVVSRHPVHQVSVHLAEETETPQLLLDLETSPTEHGHYSEFSVSIVRIGHLYDMLEMFQLYHSNRAPSVLRRIYKSPHLHLQFCTYMMNCSVMCMMSSNIQQWHHVIIH